MDPKPVTPQWETARRPGDDVPTTPRVIFVDKDFPYFFAETQMTHRKKIKSNTKHN
jgi:hypothetical protein